MTDRLAGCVALITGGSTGIGFGCARVLAEAGAQVVITARTETDGRAAEDALRQDGQAVRYLPQDVASAADWQRVTAQITNDFGRLDFLVNNAGIAHVSPIVETAAEDLLRILRVNLIGAYHGLRACVPLIAQAYPERGFPGVVVNMSSVLSRIAQDGASAYCAAKGGMSGLNVAYQRQLVGATTEAVQVRDLLPGYTMTPQVDKAIGRDSPLVADLAQGIAVRRWAEPEEIGAALLLLLDPAVQIDDPELLVDGGFLAS